MDWRDYYFAPFGSRFFHRAYGLPMPMLFPQIGQLLMRGGGAEEDEHDGYNEVAPKWLRRMQRAGIAGPMIGRNDTYSAAILPPWSVKVMCRGEQSCCDLDADSVQLGWHRPAGNPVAASTMTQ